jgi:hypothetical protein
LLFFGFYPCFGNNAVPKANSVHSDSLNLNAGISFAEKQEYDSARFFLLKSAESTDIPIKTESYLYLNFIETRLENYELAMTYLEQYHKNAMTLFHRAMETEKIKGHSDNLTDTILSIKRRNKLNLFLWGIFMLMLLAAISILIYLHRKGVRFFSKVKNVKLKNLDSEIESKREQIRIIGYSSFALQADIFKQTPLYAEIKALENQGRDKNAKVLNYEKQNLLEKELNRTFTNFQSTLMDSGAKLTQNDIKLCCLSLLPINNWAKALCFGSTDISIVKQRKHYIKQKMTKDSDNLSLFEFIFSATRNS